MSKEIKYFFILLSSAFILLIITGCMRNTTGFISKTNTVVVDFEVPVSSPDMARDRALEYIQDNYRLITMPEFEWQEADITAKNIDNTKTLLYSYNNWIVTVNFPDSAPQDRVFDVTVTKDDNAFQWTGLVDGYGNTLETSYQRNQTQPLVTRQTETPTTFIPTNTHLPTATPQPTHTPTSTPTPVFTVTPTPLPCNAAAFVSDITIPDGASFAPNTRFEKAWRLRNVGVCTWTADYDLIFFDGHRMDGPQRVNIGENVPPGETIDLSVPLRAPQSAGDYQGFWKLRTPGGEVFGVGEGADYRFWVSITVIETAGDFEYDFSINYCSATWRSQVGPLVCDDLSDPENGFVSLLTSPRLENRLENEPALWVHTNESRDGWIEGTYPAYTIQFGDVFEAWVGCLEGYESCNITFYLAYKQGDDRIYIMEQWQEKYDQEVTKINLNLSDLEGETVNFILGMESNTNNLGDTQGFWFVPRIQRYLGGGG